MAKEEVKIEKMEESDSESEEEFVLAKSHTENSSESDEMVVPSEKPKEEVKTGEGEAQDKMNKEAIATSRDRSTTSSLEATIADISSDEASCFPKANKAPLGDETLLGQIWGKYNKQADMTHFQDTTLKKVLSDAVLSPEMKSTAEKRAAGDKTLTSALWGKFDAQADQTNYQDTSLCQILAKVTVSPEEKEGRLGEKTMLRNLWSKVIMVLMTMMMMKMLQNLLPKVNTEGEVTLLGRIGDAMIETEAADCGLDDEATHDLPSPLLSQVENVRMKSLVINY